MPHARRISHHRACNARQWLSQSERSDTKGAKGKRERGAIARRCCLRVRGLAYWRQGDRTSAGRLVQCVSVMEGEREKFNEKEKKDGAHTEKERKMWLLYCS